MVMRTSTVPGSVRVARLCLSNTTFVVIIFLFFRLLVIVAPNVFPECFPRFPNLGKHCDQNHPKYTIFFFLHYQVKFAGGPLYTQNPRVFARFILFAFVIRLGLSSMGAEALILSGVSRGEGLTLGKQWENFGIKWPIFYRCYMLGLVRRHRWGGGNRRAIRGRVLTGGFL